MKSVSNFTKAIPPWFPSIFFDLEVEKRFKYLSWVCLILIYSIGIIWGGLFFNWGKTELNYADWYEINLPRLNAIQDALLYQNLPLNVDCESCLHGLTDRFFVLPDVITTPQMVVLLVLNLPQFVFFDLLLHYSLGVLALLYLRRKFNLSLFVYAVIFFLFNFNGYILSHYAIGHSTWAGYFLFPWFFILVFQIFEKTPNWSWVGKIAGLSFYIVLAGGQHHFVWMMLFLAFLAIADLKRLKWIFLAILFSGFLSAVRLLPPVLGFTAFSAEKFEFQAGYPSIVRFLSALTTIYPINFPVYDVPRFIGPWELNYFVGIVGALFIFYFGVWRWVKDYQQSSFSTLLFPTAAMFLLTQGYLYKFTLYYFPLFSSERVSSRMMSIPITLLIIIGAFYFQEFIRSKNTNAVRWMVGFSFIIMINELLSNLYMWKIDNVNKVLPQFTLDFPGNSIINHPDPLYHWILLIGLILTLISAITLIVLVWRENRMHKKEQ